MKSCIGCIPCFLKQAVNCMNIAGVKDEDVQSKVMYQLLDDVREYDLDDDPAFNSTLAFLKTYEMIDNYDPYKEAKKETNVMALKLFPRLKEIYQQSEDKLYTALKIAVAGNVIDLGIQTSFDIDEALQASFSAGFSIDCYGAFKDRLQVSENVVVLGDNSGEIVFDKLLVQELVNRGKRVTYVVKDTPILNDSTLEDAKFVGMVELCNVVTNGAGFLGTNLKKISAEARELIESADLIISKGQANFETLEDYEALNGKAFFLLKIKCEYVGVVAGAEFGEMVFFTR